jgi:UDP-3-O-[3-hydroxymyristoyl] N-acetylglucosamine deacetylase/3-hydroxyacyl-[acyl-carrier-protein] dehydratase
MSETRRTIAREVQVEGTGLHTGATVTATFRPAASGAGLLFRRTDLQGTPVIPARLGSVRETDRRVVLAHGEASVSTVEHVLAACVGLGIDDLSIDVDGPEVPTGDGSARPFVDALHAAGVADQEGSPTRIGVKAPFTVQSGGARYLIAPAGVLRLTLTIEWSHAAIGRQSGMFEVEPESFERDLAPARTFGFLTEADALRERGLSRGASESNVIVLSNEGVVGNTLRWPDEFVRHKALDLLGDLALLGGRLEADIVALRPSHAENVRFARAIERTADPKTPPTMGIEDILGVLPHRYPFLLVDRIVHIEPGRRIVGIKNVTMNEPFFPGHFPGHPVMPGVLIVEAMAQTGGLLLLGQVDDAEDKIVYFMSIDQVKFRKPVIPGDQLRFELEMLKFRGKTCRMGGVAYVDGQPVAEAEMMAAIVDR